MFWILTFLLVLLALLFVLVPLWYRRQAPAGGSAQLHQHANIALFRERSDELQAELAAGSIDQSQFEELFGELQHNLLTDVPAAAEQQPVPAAKSVFVLPLGLLLLIPLLAYSLYGYWGYRKDVQVMALFQATADNEGGAEQARQRIMALGQFARTNPERPWVYHFLGENLAGLGLFDEAQLAYARAAQLLPATAEKALVLGRVATFMYINAEFQLTPQVQAVIDEARQINPAEISILQLLATDAEQRQDWQAAITWWRALIQASPDSAMAEDLRTRIPLAQAQLGNGSDTTAAAVDGGPVVEVKLSLAAGLELDTALRVFVAVRNAEQAGMPPLAAAATTVAELPTTIRLDDSNAVGPFGLSSAASAYVSALVSLTGTATAQSGDYRVLSKHFALDDERISIELVISEQIP